MSRSQLRLSSYSTLVVVVPLRSRYNLSRPRPSPAPFIDPTSLAGIWGDRRCLLVFRRTATLSALGGMGHAGRASPAGDPPHLGAEKDSLGVLRRWGCAIRL